MKRLWILALIFLVQCTSSDQQEVETFTRDENSDITTLISQYWILADADNPVGGDLVAKEGRRDYMPGIVFIQNGEFVENPAGETTRGKFERNNDSLLLTYSDGTTGSFLIELLTPDTLVAKRIAKDKISALYYSPTNTWWPEADVNPFSEANMAWTIKPNEPEDSDQIKKRVNEYIRFIQYYVEGYSRGGATRISFVGIPNIFNFYTGGISIPNDDKNLNPKWVDCFYDRKQALEAYNMVRRVVIKDYKWDPDEPIWINQTGRVLNAMRDSL